MCVGEDKDAADTIERMEEHLRGNNVRLEDVRLRVGPRLEIDGEGFRNNSDANRLLTRNYREGFVVPERVG